MATPIIETLKLFTYLHVNFTGRSRTPAFPFKYLGISDEKILERDGNFSLELPTDALTSNTEEGINANYMTTYKLNINFLESAKINLSVVREKEDTITYFLIQLQQIISAGFNNFKVAPTIQAFIRNTGSEDTEVQRLLYKVSLSIISANNYNQNSASFNML